MEIEFNKKYEFDFTDQVQFGVLPKEEVYKLYQDGRVSSKFLEHYIPIWFPDLTYVDMEGYDHVHKNNPLDRYDLKGFTKGGAGYAPSNMIGAGRKINISEMHAHAKTINYIFSDIVDFPKISIIFKTGEELIRDYPKGKIKLNQREKLFG
jgi:hypothetical protein